jgi:hypothetical protein
MAEYLRSTLTEEGTKQYFDKYVYGVKDFNEYLELVGGVKKLKYLEALERGRARFTYPWISS